MSRQKDLRSSFIFRKFRKKKFTKFTKLAQFFDVKFRSWKIVMTQENHQNSSSDRLYSIKQTETRGRAVFASKRIPSGTTVYIASHPYITVIKEDFKKETCAWCFKYQYGNKCWVKHPDTSVGVWFCSVECLQKWRKDDYDGKLTEALSCLRTTKARKQMAKMSNFPMDLTKLVVAAIVQRSRESDGTLPSNQPCWDNVLDLQAGVYDEGIDLPSEVSQLTAFLENNLPPTLRHLITSTAFPLLSRHLSNSFGIWELPITPDSENLGSAMYPSASYFNHSCNPNVAKVREGRIVRFVTSRDVEEDEELCISYGHTERELEERRQVLKEWWGFECDCSRCTREQDENGEI